MGIENSSSGERRGSQPERQRKESSNSEVPRVCFEKDVPRQTPEQQAKVQKQAKKIRLTDLASTMVDQMKGEVLALPALSRRDRLPMLSRLAMDLGREPAPEIENHSFAVAMELDSPKGRALALLKVGYIRNHTDPESAKELFAEVHELAKTQRFAEDDEANISEKVRVFASVAKAFTQLGDRDRAYTIVTEDIDNLAPEKTFDTLLMIAEEEIIAQKRQEVEAEPMEGRTLLQRVYAKIISFDDRINDVLEYGSAEERIEAIMYSSFAHNATIRKAARLCIESDDLQGARELIPRITDVYERLQVMRALSQAFASRGWVDQSLSVIMDQVELSGHTNDRDKEKYRDEQLRFAISRLSRNGYYDDAYDLIPMLREEKKTPRMKDIFHSLTNCSAQDYAVALSQLETRNDSKEKAELLIALTNSFRKARTSYSLMESQQVQEDLGETFRVLATDTEGVVDSPEKASALLSLAQIEAELFPEEDTFLTQAESLDLTAFQDNELNLIWMELAHAQARAGKTAAALASYERINSMYQPSQWKGLLGSMHLEDPTIIAKLSSYVRPFEPRRQVTMMVDLANEQVSQGDDCYVALSKAKESAEAIVIPESKISELLKIVKLAIQEGESMQVIEAMNEQEVSYALSSEVPGIRDALARLRPEIEE